MEHDGDQEAVFSRGTSIDSPQPFTREGESSVGPREGTNEPEEGNSKGNSKASKAAAGSSSSTRKRGSKRKHDSEAPASSPSVPAQDPTSHVCQPPTLLPTGFHAADGLELCLTRGYPPNKFGFRYLPCGVVPDLTTPTGPLYRCVESWPPGVARFSWEDRSPYVFISSDGNVVSTDKGFRSARANVPLREGTTYFEVYVEKGGGESSSSKLGSAHVRLGIGRRESSVNAPVGMDAYSYGLRDKTGDKVTISQPQPYGEPFGSGDVIGVLVDLPPRPDSPDLDPSQPATIVRKRIPIRFKNQTFYESLEYIPSREMTLLVDSAAEAQLPQKKQVKQKAAAPGMKHRPLPSENAPPQRHLPVLEGSTVWFFKNGKLMSSEPAFQDLYDFLPLKPHPPAPDATKKNKKKVWDPMAERENHNDDGTLGYYPVVSCYGGAIARLNAGPSFHYPPDLSHFDKSGFPALHRLADFEHLQARYLEFLDSVNYFDQQENQQAVAIAEHQQSQAAAAPYLQGTAPLPLRSRSASQAPSSPMPQNTALENSHLQPTASTTPLDRQASPLGRVKTEEESWQEQHQQHQQQPPLNQLSEPVLAQSEEVATLPPTDQDASGESDTEMLVR